LPRKQKNYWELKTYSTGPNGPTQLPVVLPAGEQLQFGIKLDDLEKKFKKQPNI
jgi:hypothetical protein